MRHGKIAEPSRPFSLVISVDPVRIHFTSILTDSTFLPVFGRIGRVPFRVLRHDSVPRSLFALKLVLTCVALAALVYVVEWASILDAAREARPLWALAALALVPLNVSLEAFRWHRLVRKLAPDVKFKTSMAAVLSGYPLGLLTPGRIGDYVGRALYLRDISPGASATLTFAERIATLACCLVFGLVALPYFLLTHTNVDSVAWMTVLVLGILFTGFLLVLLLHPKLARALLETVLPFRRIRHVFAVLNRFSVRDATELFGLSAVRYLIFSTQFVLMVHAFQGDVSWLTAYTGVVLVFFAKSAIPSITLGDLGIRESAAVFFLGAFGVAEAAAFNASLGIFAANILLPAFVGLPLLPRLRLRSAAKRNPAKTESEVTQPVVLS